MKIFYDSTVLISKGSVGFSTSVLDKALFRAVLDALLKKQKPSPYEEVRLSRDIWSRQFLNAVTTPENEEIFSLAHSKARFRSDSQK